MDREAEQGGSSEEKEGGASQTQNPSRWVWLAMSR